MLFGQNDVLDKSISAILGAAGGMAVPSLMLWHLFRTFIPEQTKAFLATQDKLVLELSEQRKSHLENIRQVTEHCKAEIDLVDQRWKTFLDARDRGRD